MEDVHGSRTSVHVGTINAGYTDIQNRDTETLSKYNAAGTARSILSNRVSCVFDSDYNADDVTAEKTVARALGGMGSPYPISIGEVTATSIFTPTVALAETWSRNYQRVFLAGDACHRTIPSGGYGMNMGLADA